MKFLSLEGFNIEHDSYEIQGHGGSFLTIPGRDYYSIELDLSNDFECLKACIEWNHIINTYFKTSYKAYRIDIGPYIGIYPVAIGSDGIVHFYMDHFDIKRKDWKDWFVREDFEYAPK